MSCHLKKMIFYMRKKIHSSTNLMYSGIVSDTGGLSVLSHDISTS